jgi:hypothetical protein
VDVEKAQHFNSKGHFFAAAAEAMRRSLINRARDKGLLKPGGGRRRVDLSELTDPVTALADDLLDLDEALERLAAGYPQAGGLVKLRFFAGLTLAEADRPDLTRAQESLARWARQSLTAHGPRWPSAGRHDLPGTGAGVLPSWLNRQPFGAAPRS